MENNKFCILIVDDEKNIREGLKKALEPQGYKMLLAPDGREGLFQLLNEKIDLALLDIQMPKLSGLELLKRMQEEGLKIPVIFLTGHGNVETAVEAMRLGAYDFLTKPTNIEKLELLIRRALKQKEMEQQNHMLVVQVKKFEVEKLIMGHSKSILSLIEILHRVAPSLANVYIYGESGTGKELVCDAIHHLEISDKPKPLVKVNCAALTPTLLESELFGHVKGAFTGADRDKKGRFEEANGGTIFLDEVSEIPKHLQVKLLRVLQEKKIERVGSNETIDLKIRIISASNKDLKEEVGKGNFREDLFYRLNVLDIKMPPLRERKGDVSLLAKYFFDKFSKENDKEIEVTNQVFSIFENYTWPGNVRELGNIVEKMVVLADEKVGLEDIPEELLNKLGKKNISSVDIKLGQSLADITEQIIDATVKYCEGNKSKAAKILKIGRKTLYRKQDHEQEQDIPHSQ